MLDDLYTVIRSHVDNFETQLYTALPATVIEWDTAEQTITAAPVMLEAYTDGDVSKFPQIENVPVVFPSAGGGSLTFPIKKGDEVLLVFSARNYDTWWNTSEVDKLSNTQRYHDITDAIAIVGLTSKNNSTKAHPEDVELKFGESFVRLKSDNSIEINTKDNAIMLVNDGTVEVDIKDTIAINNSSEELITVLSETLQAIADITTNTVYGISPINNKPAVLALKQRLDTFKK